MALFAVQTIVHFPATRAIYRSIQIILKKCASTFFRAEVIEMSVEIVDAGAELEVEVEDDHPAEGEDAVVEGRDEKEVVRVLDRSLGPRGEERPQLRDGARVAVGERAQVEEVEIDADI